MQHPSTATSPAADSASPAISDHSGDHARWSPPAAGEHSAEWKEAVRKLDIKALPQQEAMDWAEEHPHLLKKRGGDPPGQHPSMTRKEAMKWAHIDQGARQKQHALRKLEARSDATSQDAAQWAGEHPAFLKEHPKLASSVTEAGGHPFLMKRLMAGGPNQGTNQPNQGPIPQQQQDAP